MIFHQSSASSNIRNSVFPLKPTGLVHEHSSHNLSQFYSLNFLEESMSYIERTARKLMPILNEIKNRMVPEKSLKDKNAVGKRANKVETLESVNEDVMTEEEMNENSEGAKKSQADMKNILGYLNQGEWTTSLSIGSIMQL
jgi:hypothetical protein